VVDGGGGGSESIFYVSLDTKAQTSIEESEGEFDVHVLSQQPRCRPTLGAIVHSDEHSATEPRGEMTSGDEEVGGEVGY